MKINIQYPENGEKKDLMHRKEVEKTIDLLEVNPIFENEIIRIRKKFSFPSEGFDFETNKNIDDKLKLTSNNEFIKEYQQLTEKVSLSMSWFSSIREFILYNTMFIPKKFPIIIEGYNTAQLNYRVPAILITENISKSNFIKYINENWETIEKKLKLLPKTKTNKMQRSEIAKIITDLRDGEHKSFSQIADILSKDFPDDDGLSDQANLRNIYSRWKKKTKLS